MHILGAVNECLILQKKITNVSLTITSSHAILLFMVKIGLEKGGWEDKNKQFNMAKSFFAISLHLSFYHLTLSPEHPLSIIPRQIPSMVLFFFSFGVKPCAICTHPFQTPLLLAFDEGKKYSMKGVLRKT